MARLPGQVSGELGPAEQPGAALDGEGGASGAGPGESGLTSGRMRDQRLEVVTAIEGVRAESCLDAVWGAVAIAVVRGRVGDISPWISESGGVVDAADFLKVGEAVLICVRVRGEAGSHVDDLEGIIHREGEIRWKRAA